MPLQKSFSDSNHSSKQRRRQQPWARNKSFQTPQNGGHEAPANILKEKPPMPVSTATKNKLSVFHFNGHVSLDKSAKECSANVTSEDNKENQQSAADAHSCDEVIGNSEAKTEQRRMKAKSPSSTSAPERESSRRRTRDTAQAGASVMANPATTNSTAANSRKSPSVDERNKRNMSLEQAGLAESDNPATPAGRLALPDLIGMGDMERAVNDMSPEDRVEWDQHRSAICYNGSGIRKANKRARSSSPTSSPSAHAPTHFSSKGECLDVELDPGSELWGRYSFNSSAAPNPNNPIIPTLAHIMNTSSPQPTKRGSTPRSAGLRRATSCGTQFPKRRRVGGLDSDDVFTETASIGPSKLSVLIERVQEDLTQPVRPRAGSQVDASGSARCSRINTSVSPTHALSDRLMETLSEDLSPPTEVPKQSYQDTSDYGDFDDDDDTLLDAYETRSETIPTKAPASEVGKSKDPLLQQPPFEKAEKDEFDESDDEMFVAGLEDIAATFDQKKATITNSPGKQSLPIKTSQLADSDEEFGDDGLNDNDFMVAEAVASQSLQRTNTSLMPSTQRKNAIQRYRVTNIIESEFENLMGRSQREKILFLQTDITKVMKVVKLRGFWFGTPVAINAFVHIIGTFEATGQCIVDDDHNLLILHPDHLISSTVVADSFGCTRRAVLQDRIKATSSSSPPLVYGTILHEIFQAAMLANRWDTQWLHDMINDIVRRHIEDLYTIQLHEAQAVEYLQSKMGELQAWAEVFVASKPKVNSPLHKAIFTNDDKPGAIVNAGNGQVATMSVCKLLDVEEHVWSPMYGLKGNIDATVQVAMKDGKETRNLTVPFEVKTGKNPTASHRAQTALYNLLLSDRYDVEIAYGILYYMETSETIRIPTVRRELCHMIIQRNELACFVRERQNSLPPMLKNESMCGRCYAKTSCFIYHRLAEDGTGETSGMKAKFDEVVKHLTPRHQEFFLKWDDLLTKEEKENLKFRRELWTMLSSQREELGRCFSRVVVEPASAYEEKDNPKINRYRYTFLKETPRNGFSFLHSQIVIGEPIVISDEKGHFALANGYVTAVSKKRISVAVDRRLHNARVRQHGFDELNNQVFASIMEVADGGASTQESISKKPVVPVVYRLDKDEFSNGMATVRNNLIQTMEAGPFGSREIRSLVVDLNAPRFKSNPTGYMLKDQESINVDQKGAIQKVMSAQDYALVLGMPGTGKTTTIAHIIRALVLQGKSVLLTSYTHTAVDNILLKLRDDAIKILRIGAPAKIHPEVQKFAGLAATLRNSFEEIKEAWHTPPIVATTCLGINHPIFNERTFDYCIVDEASQITLPVCLGPIRLARTFILVGDHHQLPPLVQNEEAQAGGLDISLFKHLSDQHPDSLVYLEHQYRMCEDIMTLSNNLIYDGRLKCGSKEVANRRLSIPDIDGIRNVHHTPATISHSVKGFCSTSTRGACWIRDMIDPETRVSFLNTDSLVPIPREEAKGNRIVNPTEATICVQLVESLLSVGVPAESIGVMTPFRSQLALLKHGLRAFPGVEMHTADRFQGRDKEIILLSLVRSNESKSIGELLKDKRRINVAFTRAKTKLLVVGSRETLKGHGLSGSEEMIAKFVKLLENRGWIYDLPINALESHHFELGATQVTASGVSRPATTQKAPDPTEDACDRKVLPASQAVLGKKRAFGENKENASGRREPAKKIFGGKPFKIPRMGVLADIVNDVLY